MSDAPGKVGSTENPAGVVYGILTMGALLAAESGRHENYWQAVLSAAIALLLYWFVHAYTNLLGARLLASERLTIGSLAKAFLHDWAIVRGASIPLAALLISWGVGASLATAVTAATWTCVVCVIAFELLAGIKAQSEPGELVIEGLIRCRHWSRDSPAASRAALTRMESRQLGLCP
ncbi:MAG TPA: hypothetical protein VID48_09970 [Solirubrobacteraceae bacterium]|jgi:hypothetical protein